MLRCARAPTTHDQAGAAPGLLMAGSAGSSARHLQEQAEVANRHVQGRLPDADSDATAGGGSDTRDFDLSVLFLRNIRPSAARGHIRERYGAQCRAHFAHPRHARQPHPQQAGSHARARLASGRGVSLRLPAEHLDQARMQRLAADDPRRRPGLCPSADGVRHNSAIRIRVPRVFRWSYTHVFFCCNQRDSGAPAAQSWRAEAARLHKHNA